MSSAHLSSPSRKPGPGDAPSLRAAQFSPDALSRHNGRTCPAVFKTRAGDIATQLSESCYVSDDESIRRTPVKKTSHPSSRSFSFSVGTTPGKQYPTRMSISPATSIGTHTPRRLSVTPTKTPSKSAARRKVDGSRTPGDPMSVCKASPSTALRRNKTFGFATPLGKENANVSGSALPSSSPRQTRKSHVSGEASPKHDSSAASNVGNATACDLMPPPLPRTPGGKNAAAIAASPRLKTSISPLQKRDPNQGSPACGPCGGDGGVSRGRTAKREDASMPPPSPVESPRSRTFSLGSGGGGISRSNSLDTGSPRVSRQQKLRTSSRGATAAAARCAPTPPRRGRSASITSARSQQQEGLRTDCRAACSVHEGVTTPAATTHSVASGGGLSELLIRRAREFYEQGTAEAIVGLPLDASRSFTRALRIVPGGWIGSVELLLARARVLSTLEKHEACAKDCRSALQLDPTLLPGCTLLGQACLRLGLHEDASRFLHEGLALAISHPDPSVMSEAQNTCRCGIEEASVVAAALESGKRAAGHGQHEAALAAAGRALEVAPQCTAAQEMRAAALLGLLRPLECVAFCETTCIRPRDDPGDDSTWPPPPGVVGPSQAALAMAQGVARLYAAALRGCGREGIAIPAMKALRCRDPGLPWCAEDTARWEMAAKLVEKGKRHASDSEHESAIKIYTQVLDTDPACVIPNAKAFCLRGLSRLGQGKALQALDDCYRALSLLSAEGGQEATSPKPFRSTLGMARLLRGRAYLALSRVDESISDLRESLEYDPGLAEAAECLREAERRRHAAEMERRQREKQERDRKAAREAAAVAAEAERRRLAELRRREAETAAAAAKRQGARGNGSSGGRCDGGTFSSRRTANRSGAASPFTRPDPRPSRGDGGEPRSTGGTSAAGDGGAGMKTPAKGSTMVRSPKIDSESYYRRLGLRKDASEAAIKKAYRKLALKYHPDKNKSEDAARSFRLVSEAYRILTSPDSKQQYDRTRRYSIETPPSNGAGGGGDRTGRGSSCSTPGWSGNNVRSYGSGTRSGASRHYNW